MKRVYATGETNSIRSLKNNYYLMKVFLFLAEGFEEIEAVAPIDIFRRAGIEVTTVSISSNRAVSGAHGITVLADSVFNETDFSNDFLLFLPGGLPGTTHLDQHEALKNLISIQAEKGKEIAAICAAPSILGKMGLLRGKEAICFPGFESQLIGANLSTSTIVKSGTIYTAKAAGVAIKFALRLVAELKGEEKAREISKAIFLE
ncbi:MAG: DJ-1 family glyoxalase III [Paludibacter sp.]